MHTEIEEVLVWRLLSPLMILCALALALEIAFIKEVLHHKLEELMGSSSVTSYGVKEPVLSFVLKYFGTACFID